MARAIFRRAAREDGVWGILAAAASASVLLAALAIALDFAAIADARGVAQGALDAALYAAAHDVVPSSVPSAQPTIAAPAADAAAEAALAPALSGGITYAWSTPPTVQAGPPARLAATLEVTVPMPALVGSVSFPVRSAVGIAWLP